MKIINQSIELMDEIDGKAILQKLERAGRVCYKSENNITEESSKKFIGNIIKLEHESVLEHEIITVIATTSRSVSHQLVRHRIASYSQESQRYCNYNKDKFNNEITFIHPKKLIKGTKLYRAWERMMESAEFTYFNLLEMGAKPEDAREVLPNSTKTEMVVTMNMRAWRHFLKIRTAKDSDPKIQELANLILKEFKQQIPVIFDDIYE